jgi:hypothetical protein
LDGAYLFELDEVAWPHASLGFFNELTSRDGGLDAASLLCCHMLQHQLLEETYTMLCGVSLRSSVKEFSEARLAASRD